MKTIQLIIEKNDGVLWGRIEGKSWMPTPYGATIGEVIGNLKELVEDYVAHEGKNDKVWNKINWSQVTFDLKYGLVAFFEAFSYFSNHQIPARLK